MEPLGQLQWESSRSLRPSGPSYRTSTSMRLTPRRPRRFAALLEHMVVGIRGQLLDDTGRARLAQMRGEPWAHPMDRLPVWTGPSLRFAQRATATVTRVRRVKAHPSGRRSPILWNCRSRSALWISIAAARSGSMPTASVHH